MFILGIQWLGRETSEATVRQNIRGSTDDVLVTHAIKQSKPNHLTFDLMVMAAQSVSALMKTILIAACDNDDDEVNLCLLRELTTAMKMITHSFILGMGPDEFLAMAAQHITYTISHTNLFDYVPISKPTT